MLLKIQLKSGVFFNKNLFQIFSYKIPNLSSRFLSVLRRQSREKNKSKYKKVGVLPIRIVQYSTVQYRGGVAHRETGKFPGGPKDF